MRRPKVLPPGLLLFSSCLCAAPVPEQVNEVTVQCASARAKSDGAPAEEGNDHPKVFIDEVRFDSPHMRRAQ